MMTSRPSQKWYREKGDVELADRTIDTFYAWLLEIKRRTSERRPVFREIRRVLLKPFPYKVYYRVDGNFVVAVLLIHSARRPGLV